MTLLENHARALSLGWSIETRPTATGILVHAERVMVGGKCGPASEHDDGVSIPHDDLEAALGKLFRVILPRPDARSSYDEAHGREITVEVPR